MVVGYEIFIDSSSLQCNIVMEHMQMNLCDLIKERQGELFSSITVKSMLFQLLCGINHIHSHGYFHRDIKPENILVSKIRPDQLMINSNLVDGYNYYTHSLIWNNNCPEGIVYIVKLGDFGLARNFHCKTPLTRYVSTRWYRAPEILFNCSEYSFGLDIWAFGAVAAEVAELSPLFPGENAFHQTSKILEVLGTPTPISIGGFWNIFFTFMRNTGEIFKFEPGVSNVADLIIHRQFSDLSLLVSKCLKWDPALRMNAFNLLNDDYFLNIYTADNYSKNCEYNNWSISYSNEDDDDECNYTYSTSNKPYEQGGKNYEFNDDKFIHKYTNISSSI